MASSNVKVMDYSPQVIRQFEGNKRVALEALGVKAVELIQDGMDTLYGRPIWDTGRLRGNVHHVVENSGKDTVDVGNDVDYAHFVHEGTYKMKARPYIRDSLSGAWAQEQMRQTLIDYLTKGF